MCCLVAFRCPFRDLPCIYPELREGQPFHARRAEGVFVGICLRRSGYRILNLKSNRIIVRRFADCTVVIPGTVFSYTDTVNAMECGKLTNKPEFQDVERKVLLETYDDEPNTQEIQHGNEPDPESDQELEVEVEVEVEDHDDVVNGDDVSSDDEGEEWQTTLFKVTMDEKKWTHKMFAKKFNISEENFQRLNSNIELNFKNGSTFKLGTEIVVPVQDEEASPAVMADSIMPRSQLT